MVAGANQWLLQNVGLGLFPMLFLFHSQKVPADLSDLVYSAHSWILYYFRNGGVWLVKVIFS